MAGRTPLVGGAWRAAAQAALAALLLVAGPAPAQDAVEPVPLEPEPRWPRGVGPADDAPAALTAPAPEPEDDLRPDQQLAEAVREALIDEPALRWLTVRVSRGVVELEGEVENEAQRALASVEAAGVPGVRDVRNRVEVRPPSDAGASGDDASDPEETP